MNMQTMGAFLDGESDFSRMFSMEDQPDFAQELLGQCCFPLENNEEEGSQFTTPSAFGPTPDEANVSMGGVNYESLFYFWNTLNPNMHFDSQENSNNSYSSNSVFLPASSHEVKSFFSDSNHIQAANDNSDSMNICKMYDKNTGVFTPLFPEAPMAETAYSDEDMSSDRIGNFDEHMQLAANTVTPKELHLKRKFDVPECKVNPSDDMNKRPRVTRNVQKSRKNLQSKKNQKFSPNSNDGDDTNVGPDGQSSSSYSTEEDNASQDTDSKVSEALNSNGKTRATRGSATDPQSLYARVRSSADTQWQSKRRERINERLRILQNLVPNGTKVDISTMLEEAVHYVKFLQLQIKLLSSDDLWMYAPIAYNGIDIGLNQTLSKLL